MGYYEADTRSKLIDPKLFEAEWDERVELLTSVDKAQTELEKMKDNEVIFLREMSEIERERRERA
ncbi:MAG: hypothetical protein OEW78_07175 [Nitrosopumilus sp.]|uniref:hypothetical protein n=1 Tax=Nitrosopumilus sp. TaxID=2024843 RepID=UPI00246FAAE9|nr:hypothetical protein [Nitrosopumilus sp.]MDH5431646.1 hypothetical protein [Nitrosopumilus sp.]